jgi:DNA-directed RNA polymerase subunit RPC12/RpoP
VDGLGDLSQRKEVISMQETCSQCGRRRDVEDWDPVWSNRAETEALRCPECGQLDELLWISDDDRRRLVFAEAERRWLAKLEKRVQLSHGI